MSIFAKFLLVLSCSLSVSAQPGKLKRSGLEKMPDFTATFYELDSNRKNKMYTQKMWTTKTAGQTIQTSKYVWADGRKDPVVDEKIIWDKNGFQKYIVVHHQLAETWETTRVDQKVKFELRKHKSGEVESDEEKMVPNFVVGPMIIDYLRDRWDKILRGEVLRVRFAVPARLETIGFKFERKREIAMAGRKVVEIIMKPTNFLIALLVDPIRIYYDVNTKELVRIKGRTIPRDKNGDSWDELDAEIDYFYDRPANRGGA